MKIAYIDSETSYLVNNSRNFNKISRKDVTNDNIKSLKNPGFHPIFRRYIYRKTTGEGSQIDHHCCLMNLKLLSQPDKLLLLFKFSKYFYLMIRSRNDVFFLCSINFSSYFLMTMAASLLCRFARLNFLFQFCHC